MARTTGGILDDGPGWPALGDEPDELAEKAGFAASEPSPSPNAADVLAGEAPANNVNCSNVAAPEFAHVCVDGHRRPVLAEHGSAEWLDLAEGDGSHPGSFEPEGETTDSAEEVKNIHPLVAPGVEGGLIKSMAFMTEQHTNAFSAPTSISHRSKS